MGRYLLVACLGSILTGVSQTLLKAGVIRSVDGPWFRPYIHPLSLAAYTLFLGVTLMNLYAFTMLPLKYATIIQPLNILFVGAFSRVFLRERPSRRQLAGTALILAGVAVFNL